MLHTITDNKLSLTVNEHGAEMFSIKSSSGIEYLWQGREPYWKNRAMNVFPVCGRLTNNTYKCDGNIYEMKCHGIARDCDFTVHKTSDTEMTFELISNDDTKISYPFDFVFSITYKLDNNKLIITNTIKNTGNSVMPFTTGGHPGFSVPLTEGLDFSDYHIDFGNVGKLKRLGLTDTCYVNGHDTDYPLSYGRYINLDHHLFDHDAIFFIDTPKTVKLCSDKDKHSVTLICQQMKYLGLWHTNRSDAPFVCLEPFMGKPSRDGIVDDIFNKENMILLDAGKNFDFKYELIFD